MKTYAIVVSDKWFIVLLNLLLLQIILTSL